jgi:UDP-N-acetylmuramate--alanine ligase
MIPGNCKTVYFLGIGGIGMSALARYFQRIGARVYGYDRNPSELTRELQAEGMFIHFEENIGLIPEEMDLVVYTPAIPRDHKELKYLMDRKVPVKKRSEVLGMILLDYTTLAIAGTHGKTTTSAMVTHILKTAGVDVLAFLGGISKNYSANFIAPPAIPWNNGKADQPQIFAVAEADEFDRSFLQLFPKVAVITSMDEDHLDIYKNSTSLKKAFQEFASQVQSGGTLIYKKGLPLKSREDHGVKTKTYSMKPGSDYFPDKIRRVNDHFAFDLVTPSNIYREVVLGLPGRFNLENAVAASAMALETGIGETAIREALQSFKGVVRRFDYHIRRDDMIYIDDYAHHPQEISACVRAVQEIYPGKKITGVFQPHLYSRTRDFLDSFARSLELLDELILLEIYPARENPIPGITSKALLDKVQMEKKMLCSNESFLDELKKIQPEVLLTMGAGDIDQWTEKITNLFMK